MHEHNRFDRYFFGRLWHNPDAQGWFPADVVDLVDVRWDDVRHLQMLAQWLDLRSVITMSMAQCAVHGSLVSADGRIRIPTFVIDRYTVDPTNLAKIDPSVLCEIRLFERDDCIGWLIAR